jgi:4-amino-4-deoxy-L-arabinose transferase-like glycosyltransferase
MGAVTVWTTYRLAAELIPHQTGIALGAAAFVAFLPAFTSLSAVVNNDNLIIMLSSLGVLQILRLARQPLRWRDAVLLGALLGLAPLTKLSGLVVWLFAAAVFLFVAWQSRQWRRLALYGTLCCGIAVLFIAPWAIYNLLNYGDPLGWSLVLSVTPLRRAPMTWDDLVRVIGWGLYTSFWGRFGGAIHLRMADAIYVILGGLALLASLGWVRYARTSRQAQRDFDARGILAAFGVFWLLMLAAFARWTLAVLGTDQARQLFPGLPLFAIVFTVGLAYLSVDHTKIVLTTAYGGLFGLNLAVLVYLGAMFAGSPQNLATLPRLGGAAAPADFNRTIRVVDYRVEPTRVAPGGVVEVRLQWQALSAPTENYWLLLQLAGPGELVVNKDGVPSAGRPTTDWWRTGDVFVSHHTLIVPEDAAPGTYKLRLGLHPFERWEWLPVRGQEMLVLDGITVTTR